MVEEWRCDIEKDGSMEMRFGIYRTRVVEKKEKSKFCRKRFKYFFLQNRHNSQECDSQFSWILPQFSISEIPLKHALLPNKYVRKILQFTELKDRKRRKCWYFWIFLTCAYIKFYWSSLPSRDENWNQMWKLWKFK